MNSKTDVVRAPVDAVVSVEIACVVANRLGESECDDPRKVAERADTDQGDGVVREVFC